MALDTIPRTHSFSLGDLHDFDRCVFAFFVRHHLGKKYELAEGNANQAIGSLLDLAIKKFHQIKAYSQPPEYLVNLIKAGEVQMKEDVLKRGINSFYGSQVEFLTPEVVAKAQEVFKGYTQKMAGKYKKMVVTPITKRAKPFWERVIVSEKTLKLWGGPDAIEMGEDGIPEIVDYKYFEDIDKGREYLDMDLMPKVYTLLCAEDLLGSGFSKARFKVKFWQDPSNESFYEEFDLKEAGNLENFLKDKIERILRTSELTFCQKDYCQICHHQDREKWVKELQDQGWITKAEKFEPISTSSELPF